MVHVQVDRIQKIIIYYNDFLIYHHGLFIASLNVTTSRSSILVSEFHGSHIDPILYLNYRTYEKLFSYLPLVYTQIEGLSVWQKVCHFLLRVKRLIDQDYYYLTTCYLLSLDFIKVFSKVSKWWIKVCRL